MMKNTKILIACLLSLLFQLEGLACTMVLVSGRVTPDGRPLLFKNRDSDDGLGVEMRIVETERFTYLGQYAKSSTKSTGTWGGFNEKGFVISNTLSFNVPAQSGTQNSLVMRKGLAVCETLQDFELMLDSMMVDTLLVKANFAVMDAQGNAAIYEVWEDGYSKYDVNDPEVAPNGVLVRSNFCISGTVGYRSGEDRYRIASNYMEGFQGNLVGWQDLLPMSRLLVDQSGVDLRDSAPMDYYDETKIELNGYIPRNISTNVMVIQGVKNGESPLLTTCWATVGAPLTTVVVPFCLTLDKELPVKAVSEEDKMAWLCEKGKLLKNKVFKYKDSTMAIDLSKLYNQEETGILQTIMRLEEEVVRRGEELLDEAREAGDMAPAALHGFYEWLDPYLENEYALSLGWEPLKEGYLVLSADKTKLTFYYDINKDSRTGTVYALDAYAGLASKTAKKVKSVSFDPSFADALPTSTSSWFKGMSNLASIEGMEYLNTSNVTGMSSMFEGCAKLTTLNLTNFDTSGVTTMSAMFKGCSSLKNLDLTNFDTSQTTNTKTMFTNCSGLDSLVVSGTMDNLDDFACNGVGTEEAPCKITTPKGFEFGVPTKGVFQWRGGWFIHLMRENQTYIAVSEDETVITFYDDNRADTRQETIIFIGDDYADDGENDNADDVGDEEENGRFWHGWHVDEQKVKKVVFDSSFADARPLSCQSWFEGFCVLEELEGLENLNTSEVKSMESMFAGCSSLANIDLSHFDTSKIENMRFMFMDCSSLAFLDLGGFDIEKAVLNGSVNDGGSVDNGASYDGSGSDEVSDDGKDDEERSCDSEGLLSGCVGLKHLVLSSSLSRLYDGGEEGGVPACKGVGTESSPCLLTVAYDFDFGFDVDSLDNFKWKGGWFTLGSDEKISYLVFSEDRMNVSFYHDGKKAGRKGTVCDLDEYEKSFTNVEPVKSVIFNSSFAEARPTSTRSWFNGMSELVSIEGLEYLNTSDVKDMSMMFYGCGSLKKLDVSSFDTSNVFDMGWMFCGCGSLAELDVTHFNTSKVTRMTAMFYDDSSLTNLDVTHFDTSLVKDLSLMFYGCSSLENLDVSSFNTSNVTTMEQMFGYCSTLASLDVRGFNTSKVMNMRQMFNACVGLKSLDLGNFVTSESTNTVAMLGNCYGLENLVVSGTMDSLDDYACNGVGQEDTPCLIVAPEGFDFGVDTIGYFKWKNGWFTLDHADSCSFMAKIDALAPGGIAKLELSLDNGHGQINAFQLELTLPAGVTLVEDGDGYAFILGNRCDSMLVEIAENIERHYKVVAFFLDEEKAIEGPSGPVITLSLKADEEVVRGVHEAMVDNIVLSNLAFDVIELAPFTFPIFIPDYRMGDVNHDGDVNVVDVMMTVSHILGKPLDNFHTENADMNGDGDLNVADVMGIVDFVLHYVPSSENHSFSHK